ncbi:MAG: hypothetical protein D6730_06010 [Bacteroidetes bacterium]|nr:MAG: hypothetical protein D6730_06010 [Bacteroidota bacterium]
MGIGIQKVARDHAQTIARANLQAGREISRTLKEGFDEVQQQQAQIHEALVDQTGVIQRGLEAIELSLDEGFDKVALGLNEVANRVDGLGDVIISSQEKLQAGIKGLKASMDMGMANIVTHFELQRSEIKEGFDMLANILENNQKTLAHERYRDGKEAYDKYLQHPDEPQFLTDALDYLLESARIYRSNAFCHLYLGHIYQEPARYYDLYKSLEHYKLCAVYAKGMANNGLAALGYFMAGWISYVLEDVEGAIEMSEKALQFDKEGLPENYYNLAKFFASMGQAQKAIEYLDVAVRSYDPMYSLKASIDEDFSNIRPTLDQYFTRIRDEEARVLEERLLSFGLPLPELGGKTKEE